MNMKLDVAIFEVPPLRASSEIKMPSPIHKPMFTVCAQIATNTRKIEKDETLNFTTMDDDDSE